MATELFANRPVTVISAGGTDAPSAGTVETWTVVSSTGFPAASTSVSQFHIADNAAPTEIIAVTNVSGTSWTVTRGAEGTTPLAHSAGFTVSQTVTAGFLGSCLTAPALADSATVYVTADGSDSYNGLSWAAGKATIGAAIAALPSGGGTVEIGAGTWTFATTARTDASVTYNTGGGHAGTWTDASATGADVGSYIIGANINGRAPKITAVSGGYITTDIAPGGTVTSQSVTIVKPGIVIPDGVTLQGQGSTTTSAAPNTLLVDGTGTGIVVFARGGNNVGDYFGRSRIRDLAIWGSSNGITYGTTLAGLWVNNNDSFFEVTNCDISGHGTCALGLDYNVNSLDARNTLFGYNGTAGSSTATGGVLIDPFCAFASASVCFYDCWWVNNYGFGVIGVASGANTPVSLYSCQLNETKATSTYLSGTAVVNYSGLPALLMNCWIESSDTYDAATSYGNLVIVGSVLYSAISYAIYANNAAATVTLIGTLSQNHTTATINNNGANVSWLGCSIQDSAFISGVATPAQAAGVGSTGPGTFGGPVDVSTAGKGLQVKEGSNAKQGTATLNGTTAVVVSNTSVTSSSRIFLTVNSPSGAVGTPYVSATSAGTSFSIKSTSGSDASVVAWLITEPG